MVLVMLVEDKTIVSNFNNVISYYDGSKEKQFVICDDLILDVKALIENKDIVVYKRRIGSCFFVNIEGLDIYNSKIDISKLSLDNSLLISLVYKIATGTWEYFNSKIKIIYNIANESSFKLGEIQNVDFEEVVSKREFCDEVNVYIIYSPLKENILIQKKYNVYQYYGCEIHAQEVDLK